MQQLREMLGTEELGAAAARVAAANAGIVRGAAAALEGMKRHSKTSIGRMVYNCALGTVVGEGEHTSDPAASLATRAEVLGVRPATYREANARMRKVDFSVPPQQALEEGHYLWAERKTRRDVRHPRVVDLAKRYWHCDDVSRASGDSGKKAMWRPSKKAGEEYHPRRQLMVHGDKVHRMFLEWPPYVALKAELMKEDATFKDPGRSTFLTTRCGCLVEPRVSQCACEIHTQQSLYLEALAMVMGSMHEDCDCTCSWCDGGEGCKKWTGMCRNLHNFSEELLCEKVDLLAEDTEGGFEHWGRKPECVAGECSDCGFGNPDGIPTDCAALAASAHRMMGWIRFEDQKMEDGKTHKKQQLPQVGPLGDL
ncbi:unnamed protein product [Pylaiella littoralis]